MMQVEYKLKLGQDEFTLRVDVKDEKEFFEKISFYSNLPKTGPNGETDVKLVHRTTKEGHNYYSLISEKADKEFKFGQAKEAQGGGLFPKGWTEMYRGENNEQPNNVQNNPVGIAQPAPTQYQQTQPVNQGYVPPSIPSVGMPLVQPPQQYQQPVTAPVAPPYHPPIQTIAQPMPQTVTQPLAPNPQVAQVATDVLARFGVRK